MIQRCLALACLVPLLTTACQKHDEPPRATAPPPPTLAEDAAMPTPPPPLVDADATALATATNAFAFDLWAAVKTSTPGNLAISPASIAIALAMTWSGAKGATAAQLGKVLHFDGDPGAVAPKLGSLLRQLEDPKRALTLRVANRLFGERSFHFEPAFLAATKAAFGAPLEPVDFNAAADAARVHINQWVEDRTEHRIKDLLPSGALDAMTRLVLVNALYFLADWQAPFDKTWTIRAPFMRADGKASDVPTMHHRGPYGTAVVDGVRVIELPYKGGDAAMLIAMPAKPDGLAALESSVGSTRFAGWRAALKPQEIVLGLPVFTIDPPDALELSKALQALGAAAAFDPHAADFTGIGTPPEPDMRLYISAVFHKAFVKVNEQGTEAAAATAVVMAVGGAAPAPAPEVNVDHPFLFFIVDTHTGIVLFAGRVTDPA